MALDLLVLLLLLVSSVHGAVGGALRQLAGLAAVILAGLAARHLIDPVASGLSRTLPHLLARPAAAGLLFVGTWALVSLVAGALLRTRLSGSGAPLDRGAGALLGGAKGGLAAWVFLSALALVGAGAEGGFFDPRVSDFARLARAHNLLVRLDPAKAEQVERVLRSAREAQRAGGSAGAAGERLLSDPRLQGLEAGGPVDPAEAAQLLADPQFQALVQGLRAAQESRQARGEGSAAL